MLNQMTYDVARERNADALRVADEERTARLLRSEPPLVRALGRLRGSVLERRRGPAVAPAAKPVTEPS